MSSEISQTDKDKYCILSLICRIYNIKQKSEYNKTDIENKLVVTNGEKKGEVKGRGRELKGTNNYV